MTTLFAIFLALLLPLTAGAAAADSVRTEAVAVATVSPDSMATATRARWNPLTVVVPGALVGTGIVGLAIGHDERSEPKVRLHDGTTVDNFLQFAPAATSITLSLCGARGKHTMREQMVVRATAFIVVNAAALSLKWAVREQRPDGTDHNAFPSGHAARAFMGAEMLRREYGATQPLAVCAGYGMAVATAALRVAHNRHWATDVLAGAGLGMLSVEAAYRLYPTLSRLLPQKKRKTANVVLAPAGRGVACLAFF